jgi:hypothetical protein
MNAQKLAFFVIAFALAGAVINEAGIFNPIQVYEIEEIDSEFSSGVTEIDGTLAEDDLQSDFDGWSMVFKTIGLFTTVLGVLVIPYNYLTDIGVNESFALAIQVIANLTVIWGVIQFMSGRSTKGMD